MGITSCNKHQLIGIVNKNKCLHTQKNLYIIFYLKKNIKNSFEKIELEVVLRGDKKIVFFLNEACSKIENK